MESGRAPKRLGLAASAVFALGPAVLVAQTTDDIFAAADSPSLNFYGLSGLVDMPTAHALPNGQIAGTLSYFGGTRRGTLTFQATKRITASFRYVGIENWNSDGFATYRDRSFDFRFLLKQESRYWPAVSVGLQDLAGTGIYSGEYVVATKTFETETIPGRIRITGGLGWGRLGTSGSIGSPFGDERPTFDPNEEGGELSAEQWFRGPVAPFGGIEWQINDRFGVKAEYSSDAYVAETVERDVFTRKSRFNFGAEYQITDSVRLGGYYLYGSEFGVNLQYQFNPDKPPNPIKVEPVAPLKLRPSREKKPAAWNTEWASSQTVPLTLRDQLIPILDAEGVPLQSLKVSAEEAELRFVNDRYQAVAVAIGRAARAMAQVMPASVETFRLVPIKGGLVQSTYIIRRSDLEALEFAPQSAESLLAVTGVSAAAPGLPGAIVDEDLYPDFAWSITPYFLASYFDPDRPIRIDGGIQFNARYRPAEGWIVSGQVNQRLFGNIGDSDRLSDSVLPRVRTDAVLYARGGDTYLDNLYVSKQWKPSSDYYARATLGYLELMFAGASTELLWKPVSSSLALGIEANYVKQRDYDGAFGFLDYSVATGHASAYYEFGENILAQVDVGRYLAGDVGATFTLTREFRNGWRVGGFFTLTDVSAEDFGEGSFDKGFNLTIPVGWFLGQPDKRSITTTIRPIQRDGGQRLEVPGRLYEQVRSGHRNAVEDQWSRFWE